MTEGKLPAPPYVAFKTMENFLDWLGEVGVPDRLDRSFWGQKLSGAYGAQLIAALRFFDLVSDRDVPRPALEKMASDVGERKRLLSELISTKYGEPLRDLDLERATAGQLAERFRRYSISGETFRRAIVFFIHAALYCDIPLSPHITRPGSVVKASGAVRARSMPSRSARRPTSPVPKPAAPPADNVERLGLHPTIEALLRDLNARGGSWDSQERQSWIDTFVAVMNYAYPAQ